MRHALLAAASLLALTGVSAAEDLPGSKVVVTAIAMKRMQGLRDPTLSTFIIDYPPGGSAMLHHPSTAGYVLVHVLSGAVAAEAWQAGMGVYRAGETWVEPAFANDIASRNASAAEPARALVVLVTEEVAADDGDE